MKRLTREHLFMNRGDLSSVPQRPPLHVELGEAFEIETVDTGDILMLSEKDKDKPKGPMAGNPSTGPVYVEGIKAGDVIAVHIEDVQIVVNQRMQFHDQSFQRRNILLLVKILERHELIQNQRVLQLTNLDFFLMNPLF